MDWAKVGHGLQRSKGTVQKLSFTTKIPTMKVTQNTSPCGTLLGSALTYHLNLRSTWVASRFMRRQKEKKKKQKEQKHKMKMKKKKKKTKRFACSRVKQA